MLDFYYSQVFKLLGLCTANRYIGTSELGTQALLGKHERSGKDK